MGIIFKFAKSLKDFYSISRSLKVGEAVVYTKRGRPQRMYSAYLNYTKAKLLTESGYLKLITPHTRATRRKDILNRLNERFLKELRKVS